MKNIKVEVLPPAVEKNNNRNEDLQDDYEYSRNNLRELIEKGGDALDSILDLWLRACSILELPSSYKSSRL